MSEFVIFYRAMRTDLVAVPQVVSKSQCTGFVDSLFAVRVDYFFEGYSFSSASVSAARDYRAS